MKNQDTPTHMKINNISVIGLGKLGHNGRVRAVQRFRHAWDCRPSTAALHLNSFTMMNPSFAMTVSLALLLVANLLTKLWLSGRQVRHVVQHRPHVPDAFAHTISLQAHQKAADYTLAKSRYGVVSGVFDTVVLAVVLFSGGLPALYRAVMSWGAAGAGWTQTLFVLIAMVLVPDRKIPVVVSPVNV
jgi:hypothetical protein